MKLFVDDIRSAPDSSWQLERTISDSIRAINMFDFDVISLDHDIEGSRETFDTVALFLVEKYRDVDTEDRPEIILHTANPVGAKRMFNILVDFKVSVKEARWWD